MSVFYDLNKTPRNILNQAIVRAIVSENNGALFDPSDLSTLFQDSAGTTPVTAVEQPVGKMLDKSGNGYHATQSITASRPTLSARYNLLTKTEDFADAVWGKMGTGGVTVLSNVATAPDGTTTADKLIANNVAGTHYIQQLVTYKASAQHTYIIGVKAAEVSSLRLFIFSMAYGTTFNASTGGFSGTTVGLTTAAAQLVDGWWLVSLTATASASPVNRLEIYTKDNSAGDGASGIYIWGADLRLGTTSGPYQRVNTSTDYDTDERYFKKYLRFDGVDDYLNLPYMGLYAAGSASGVYAITNLQQTQHSALISERDTASTQSAYIPRWSQSSSNILDTYIRNNAGTILLDSAGVVDSIRDLRIESFVDTGINFNTFKNSVITESSTYSRSGSLILVNTTIGASVSTTTTAFSSHNNYGLIITKSALTDAQRIACERYLGRKSGVQL